MIAMLLLVLLWPVTSWAAISCGDVTPFNNLTPSDPETVAYTTPAGSNQVLFVGVVVRTTTVTIDGLTHAGNAMTEVAASSFLSPIRVQLFYIVNPTSGTNNVVAQFSAAPLTDAIVIWTCSGVDTANPIRDQNSATGTGTAVSVTVASVNSGDVVVDIMGTDVATTTPTEGANQTALNKNNDGAELGWGASQQAGANGGVMEWTTTLSQEWSIMAASLRPLTTSTRRAAPMVFP